MYGHKDTVQLLLSAGAAKDSRNRSGETPFIRACRWGHKDVASALVAAGANTALQDVVWQCDTVASLCVERLSCGRTDRA